MSKGVKKDMSSVFVFGTKNFLATMGKLLKNGFIAAYAKIINGNAMVSSHVW